MARFEEKAQKARNARTAHKIELIRPVVGPSDFLPTDEQKLVIGSKAPRLIVFGGPGSGKTATLVETVVSLIKSDGVKPGNSGIDPNSILVLTYGRERASELRDKIVIQSGANAFEPIVRTFHSLAFSIINTQVEADDPKYVLISGAEQDSFIRELLANPEHSPQVKWPKVLEPALSTKGFARELRDLILRASERNFTYKELIERGHLLNEPWWEPAANFWKIYDQILGIRYGFVSGAAKRIDSSSIISQAIFDLNKRAKIRESFQNKFKVIVIDEFQESDNSQRDLLDLLASDRVILFADPQSAIGQFRGADPEGVRSYATNNNFEALELTTALRTPNSITELCNTVSTKFRNPGKTIEVSKENDEAKGAKDATSRINAGKIDVAKLASQSDCANYIAHAFRTAHLRDGVAWSQMAVILRSPGAGVSAISRAFALNNIPVRIDSDAQALGENPAIKPILTIAQIALGTIKLIPSNWDLIEEILFSEFGGADALSLRQMRIDLGKLREPGDEAKPSTQIILEIIDNNDAPLPWEQLLSLKRIADVIAEARKVVRMNSKGSKKVDIADLIWAIWSTAKNYEGDSLATTWRNRALKGGMRGAAADRDLDAVITLFESARRFAERMPDSDPQLFLDQILSESIQSDAIAAHGQRGEVVSVMTVHSAKGLEWDLVAITGLQEGVWPNLKARGSLLGSERLVESERTESTARREIETSAANALVEDERRLLKVAISRAKQALVVTAYSKEDDSEPSQYFEEIYEAVHGTSSIEAEVLDLPRSLTPQALVSTLRRNLEASDSKKSDSENKEFSAKLLQTLAVREIQSAKVENWLGGLSLSTTEPILPPDAQVSVSPSNLQSFSECGLKWFIEKSGGRDGDSTAQLLGIAIHSLAAMLKGEPGLTFDELATRLENGWQLIDGNKGWVRDYQFKLALEKLEKFYKWYSTNKSNRTLFAVEAEFNKVIGRALFNGSVDRVEVDSEGRVYIVDLKTGAPDISKKKAEDHKQLAGYQLAVYEEAFTGESPGTESAGAELLFLGTGGNSASAKPQPVKDHETIKAEVIAAADGMSANEFIATVNDRCRMCAVKGICPIQPQGRTVIDK
ncbi:MAG: ATP-dependent DNA helicase [Actinomycetota bacterium]|nr:ATP-dependent DNA helicase [Actinomycetota bacterium]